MDTHYYSNPSKLWNINRLITRLPTATVYAVFVGLGTLGTVAVDIIFFGAAVNVGVNGIQKVSAGKKKSGFTFLILGFVVSLTLLSIVMSTIPLGVAYAVWTGMGTVGSVVIGMIFYNNSADRKRIFFLSLIIIAVIGLRIVSN